MASLAGRSLVSSYKELLKLNNLTPNSGVSASLQTVEDGFAGATALQLSNAGIASTGTLAVTGDLSVNTNKFNVTAASGNTSIAGSLTATGDLAVNTNKFNVTAASGNTAVAGTLAVTGASTLNALSATTGSFNSTLSATGNLAINTNKFTVTAASGNTAVAGTLSAVGDFAINTNKFMVTAASGNVSSAGTLSVTGDLNVNTSKFSVLASTGNTSISGTLTVSDAVDFASTGAMRIPRGTAGQRPAGDTGMLRFNTNTQSFEGHNGVAWGAIGGSGGVGTSQYVRQTFVATAGQTSFTVTGGYTPDSVDVFQNGVKLVNGSGNDVTITSGTAVVLATGAAAGDVIDVIGLASGNFAGPATAKRQNFTATAGQTVFTVTGGYTPNQLDVFQNGTKLVTSVDVDVSNGSTFTLVTPAVVGDNIEVVGFTAANTIAGTLKFQAGTAAAPSITRFEDENTGIFFPAADTIAFSEGGTESMRIDSSGNVGIGTTSPTSKLDIKSANAAGAIQLTATTGTNGSYANFVNSSGAFIIGKDSSTGNNLAGAPYSSCLYSQGAYPMIFCTDSTERLRIDSSGNVGIGTTSPAAYANSTFLTIYGASNGGITYGTSSSERTELYHNSTESIIKAVSNRPLWFGTNNTERLRIDSSGNVGIGTTSPTARLHINGTGDLLQLSSSGNGTLYAGSDVNNPYLGTSSNHALRIVTNATERLRITSGGEVGIGLTNPTARLSLGFNGSSVAGSHFVNTDSGSAGHNYILFYRNTSTLVGSITCTNTATSYNTSSDYRLKTNIEPISNGIDRIKQLPVYRFNWIVDESGNKVDGFVAHEAQAIVPECVTGEKDAVDADGKPIYQGIDQSKIVPLLTAALKEAIAKIETLESKVAAMEAA